MSDTPAQLGPWLALAGLGLFHGINPAMGWLFAVALGLHRHSQNVVFLSLIPIAVGHAFAVAAVLVVVLALGLVLHWTTLSRVAGLALIGWAIWHAVYGHRRRVRIGMQTGMAGLALWSFFMASAHGAGLMLIPVVVPLCLAASPAQGLTLSSALSVSLAALSVHTGTMLAMIALISIVVYRWIGVEFLTRGWINLDLLWAVALGLCGALLLIT
ncbi:MAG TPA: hypothetical protein VIY07_13605 [Pseudolabrys sp.]